VVRFSSIGLLEFGREVYLVEEGTLRRAAAFVWWEAAHPRLECLVPLRAPARVRLFRTVENLNHGVAPCLSWGPVLKIVRSGLTKALSRPGHSLHERGADAAAEEMEVGN